MRMQQLEHLLATAIYQRNFRKALIAVEAYAPIRRTRQCKKEAREKIEGFYMESVIGNQCGASIPLCQNRWLILDYRPDAAEMKVIAGELVYHPD